MKWYTNQGIDSDVVLSTRVRLARNLRDYPFPYRLDAEAKKQVNSLIGKALLDGDDTLTLFDMSELDAYKAVSLAEKHLISPEFACEAPGRALILSKDEDVSVMLCEEDHARIQVIFPDFRSATYIPRQSSSIKSCKTSLRSRLTKGSAI